MTHRPECTNVGCNYLPRHNGLCAQHATIPCAHCGQPIPAKLIAERHSRARFCSARCRDTLMPQERAQRRQAIVEDTTELLDAGEPPTQIATRLGYRDVRSLARVLHRWGHHDLACRFERHRPSTAGRRRRTTRQETAA
jgi:endogenous inhibitor of DNA gyrase (YacG/DUF329 family)